MTSTSRTRRGHDHTGRSTGKFVDPRFKELNSPPKGEPWCWQTSAMIASNAWRAKSQNAALVIDCIRNEHMEHGGALNGELPVTYSDFEDYGVRRHSIKAAICEAIALGFIEIAQMGTRGYGPFKGRATLYRIAWLPTRKGDAPKNGWNRFLTLHEARAAAKDARKNAAPKSVKTREASRIRAASAPPALRHGRMKS